jgi:hypothetical protein
MSWPDKQDRLWYQAGPARKTSFRVVLSLWYSLARHETVVGPSWACAGPGQMARMPNYVLSQVWMTTVLQGRACQDGCRPAVLACQVQLLVALCQVVFRWWCSEPKVVFEGAEDVVFNQVLIKIYSLYIGQSIEIILIMVHLVLNEKSMVPLEVCSSYFRNLVNLFMILGAIGKYAIRRPLRNLSCHVSLSTNNTKNSARLWRIVRVNSSQITTIGLDTVNCSNINSESRISYSYSFISELL